MYSTLIYIYVRIEKKKTKTVPILDTVVSIRNFNNIVKKNRVGTHAHTICNYDVQGAIGTSYETRYLHTQILNREIRRCLPGGLISIDF